MASGKGGVGKTTAAANVAAASASGGARVLVVDADQQTSATSVMLTRHHTGRTILDAVEDPASARECIIPSDWSHLPEIRDAGGVIDLLPGHEHFTDNVLQPTPNNPRRLFALKEAITTVQDTYDMVVIDCPPSKGPIVQSALLASDSVIVVTTPEFLDIRGLAETLRFVDAFTTEATAVGENSAHVGYIIVNKLDIQQRDHRDGLAEISSQITSIPWRQAPRRAVIPRVTAQGLPLVAADDRAAAPVAEALRALTADILEISNSVVLQQVAERLRGADGARRRTPLPDRRPA